MWRERPTPTLTPRRWYLVAIPILMTASSLAVLLITSLVFALAHIPGSIIAGGPPAVIAFQLGGLIIAGAS